MSTFLSNKEHKRSFLWYLQFQLTLTVFCMSSRSSRIMFCYYKGTWWVRNEMSEETKGTSQTVNIRGSKTLPWGKFFNMAREETSNLQRTLRTTFRNTSGQLVLQQKSRVLVWDLESLKENVILELNTFKFHF